MKIAIVCDWLVTYAGAERVLEQMLKLYPEADVFCVVDFIRDSNRDFLLNKDTKRSFIQQLPFAKTKYRSYLPLMPLAIEQLDVSEYDLVISSSHAVAKGIITGPDQVHISYVHTPIRYAWDLQHQYLKETGLDNGFKGMLARLILHYIRMWDYRTANGVDYFVANSNFIARRIKKAYGRDSVVIYPPVDVEAFTMQEEKENFYFTASRMVPYKKVKLIVEVFNEMPEKELVVIGDGTEYEQIVKIAKSNVRILGYQSFEVLKDYMQRAKAFVFAAEEDFGITPVEAQACGTPVIAYGRGGALETIMGLDNDMPTGVFFYEQTIESIKNAIDEFEVNHKKINSKNCRKNAEKFSGEIFKNKFNRLINSVKRNGR